MSYQVKSPVALCMFVRYEPAKRVFEAIRQMKPSVLLVSANAPRLDRPGEAEKVAAVRSIADQVDWKCEVLKNYPETHLDIGQSLTKANRFIFDNVEEAIVLEDDCLPNPSLFRFCDELLERYRDDERIFSINVNNYQLGRKRTDYSYYFSRYTHTLGWASWRRTWKNYDFDMKLWPEIKKGNFLKDVLGNTRAVSYWTKIFDAMYEKRMNSWDYAWLYTCWLRSGLNITPCANLVSNIGFGPDADVYKDRYKIFDDIPADALEFPLKHPPYMIRDEQADSFTQRFYFQKPFFRQFRDDLKRILSTDMDEKKMIGV